MGFCDGMMFCFRRCGKKGGKFFRSQPKERTSCIVKYVLNKLVQNGWMVKLYHRENDGFCCFGNPSREWKACKFEIKRNISVKISAKLIRNFKKKTYDEINAKIFGDPFSLLSLKNSRFCWSFQSFYLFGQQFSSKKTPSGHGEATKNPGWFQNELFSTGVIKLPILGGIKQYKSIWKFWGFPF